MASLAEEARRRRFVAWLQVRPAGVQLPGVPLWLGLAVPLPWGCQCPAGVGQREAG